MNTSIIICTYNEESTIYQVVAACCKHNPEAEVIVVDDGSTDSTEYLMELLGMHYSFTYLRLNENKGTSYAMAHGVEYASGEVILFFDADLLKIRKEHFLHLFNPICGGEADMVLGVPETLIDYGINPFKSLIGQRVMYKKDLLPILSDIREMQIGVEIFINFYLQSKRKRIKIVLLDGLEHSTKCLRKEFAEPNNEFVIEGQEIAINMLSNLDLMTKRLENKVQKTDGYTQSTITSVQHELNKRLKTIKKKMDETSIEKKVIGKNFYQETD